MEKWERRDAKRAKTRKMRVDGTSVMQLQRIIMAKAKAVSNKHSTTI